MINQVIGNYIVRSSLGEGASAHVYCGEHMYLHTRAAIKVLHTTLAEQERVRFEEEARLIARLNHPHIVRLMEYGVQDGHPYLIMDEACESLRRKMPRGVPLSLDQLIIYVRQIASTLQYIHNQGLVHRDVKPENILLNQKGEALLSDFGTATADCSQFSQSREEARGTTYYMAPEQWQGRPEVASDQYSLAVVAYEWLAGTPPFTGATWMALGIKHRLELPPPLRKRVPMLDPSIESVVLKALSKDPAERFLHVQEFATELEKAYLSVAASAFHPTDKVSPLSTQPRLRAVTLTSVKTIVPPALSLPSNPRLPVVSPPVTQIDRSPTSFPSTPSAVIEKPNLSTVPVATPPASEQPSAPPARQGRVKVTRRQALLLGGGIMLAGIVGSGAFLLNRSSSSQKVTQQMASPTPASLLHFTLSHAQPELITAIAASPLGTLIASGGGTSDYAIEVWDTHTSNLPGYPYNETFKNVNTLAWSADGQYLALVSDDGKVYAWDNSNHQQILAEHYTQDGNADGRDNKMKSVAWFRNNLLAASGDNGHVKIYQMQGQKMAEVYSFLLKQVGDVDCVTWSPDGQFLAFGTSNTSEVQIWNIVDQTFARKPTQVSTLSHDAHVNGVIWAAQKNQLISSTRTGYVRSWDMKDMHTPSLISSILTRLNLSGIALSPDERMVACLSINGVLQLYDFNQNKLWEYSHDQNSVTSANWLAKEDGNGLAIGVRKTKDAKSGVVEIWRMT